MSPRERKSFCPRPEDKNKSFMFYACVLFLLHPADMPPPTSALLGFIFILFGWTYVNML